MATARIAASNAGRFDRLHGDEDHAPVSAADEAAIERLAEQKLAERLNEDHAGVYDLLSGIETSEIDPHLHRMLTNEFEARKNLIEAFPNGMPPAVLGLMMAVNHITSRIAREAATCWMDECRDKAAEEVLSVEA